MVSFEICQNGAPGFYWRPIGEAAKSLSFDDINVKNGKWTHVAIVITPNAAKCYINGALAQTIEDKFLDIDASTSRKNDKGLHDRRRRP